MPFIKEGCIKCEKCIDICPFEAIDIVGNSAKIDMSICTNCGKCIHVCPIDIVRPDYERNENRERKWFDE